VGGGPDLDVSVLVPILYARNRRIGRNWLVERKSRWDAGLDGEAQKSKRARKSGRMGPGGQPANERRAQSELKARNAGGRCFPRLINNSERGLGWGPTTSCSRRMRGQTRRESERATAERVGGEGRRRGSAERVGGHGLLDVAAHYEPRASLSVDRVRDTERARQRERVRVGVGVGVGAREGARGRGRGGGAVRGPSVREGRHTRATSAVLAPGGRQPRGARVPLPRATTRRRKNVRQGRTSRRSRRSRRRRRRRRWWDDITGAYSLIRIAWKISLLDFLWRHDAAATGSFTIRRHERIHESRGFASALRFLGLSLSFLLVSLSPSSALFHPTTHRHRHRHRHRHQHQQQPLRTAEYQERRIYFLVVTFNGTLCALSLSFGSRRVAAAAATRPLNSLAHRGDI
jgi:hypothetical protein